MNFKTTFVCFVLFHWLHLSSVFAQGCSQYVAYDCANTTWINSQNDYTLSLSAYKTFSGSDGWIQFTGDNAQMSCRATRSCEKLKFIKDATTLYCHGDSACNKISTIKVDGGNNYNGSLKCWGPNTCANVNSMTSSDYCDCLADFSCAYSNIVCKDGWFGGAYSMYNSKIESPGDGNNNVIFSFSGYFAGYNSSLICNSGDTCYINCYGNGCTNLIVDCVDASQCYFDCDDSELRTCPTLISNVNWTVVNNNNNNDLDFLVDTLTLSENKETLCNYGLGSLLYDDAYAFADYSLTDVSTTDEDSSICCRGAFSCSGETYTTNGGGTIAGVSSLSTGAADSDIICSTYGCDATTMDSSNNIYCDGYRACEYATITAKNNIYCQSAVSCAGTDINNANIVYCLSQQACDGATMNNINTVYILSDPIEFTVTAFITSSGGSDYVTSNDANYENINDTTTTVNLMTYESGDNVLIKCSNNDRCRINCLVNGACGDTYPTLICNGECIICCNDTLGITCPSTSTISGTGSWIFDDSSICQSSLASHSIRTNAINDSINIASAFTTTIDTTTIAPTTTTTIDSGTTVVPGGGVESTSMVTNTNVESSQDTQEESTTIETEGSGNNNGQGNSNNNNDSSSSSSDGGLSPALQLIIGAIGGAIVMFISFVICVKLVHRYEKRQNDKDNRRYLGSTSKSTNGVAIEAVSIDGNNNNNNNNNNNKNQKKKQLWGKKNNNNNNKNELNNAIVATRDQENDGEEDHIGQPINNDMNGSVDNLMVVDDGQPNMLNNNDINMINHMNMINMMNQMNESLKNLQNFQNNMAMGMNNNNNNNNDINNMNNMNMAGMGMNGINGMNNRDAAMNIAAMGMNMGAMNMNMGGMNMNMNMNMNMGRMNNNNFNNINSLLPLNAVKSLSSSAEVDGNPVIDPSAIISSTPNGIINNNNNEHMDINHVNLSNNNNNNNNNNKNHNNHNNNDQFVSMNDEDSSSDEVMENIRMHMGNNNKNILNDNNQASSNVNVNDDGDGDGDGDDDVDLKGITPYS